MFRTLTLGILAIASCAPPMSPAPAVGGSGTVSTNLGDLSKTPQTGWKLETVVTGLQVPWTIVFDPDGSMIFTERPGRVRIYEDGELRPEPLLTISDLSANSESGLMGMCLHSDYAKNKLLYLAYSYRDAGQQYVKVVRYKNDGKKLSFEKLIIDKIQAAPNHAGTRVAFGPDEKLYVTTGDATDRFLAQKMDSLSGKTLRLNEDGSVPDDNPYLGKPGVRPEVWSSGHRNSQGMDWQPGTGQMFQTEHGPSGFEGLGGGGCEFNVVDRGKDYGWPTIHHSMAKVGMEAPLVEYSPASAPGSGHFYRGKALPMFTGDFLYGALRGSALVRIVLDGRNVVKQERLVTGLGRIREVAEGPDGAIYFSTSNRDGRGRAQDGDDRILRIVPD